MNKKLNALYKMILPNRKMNIFMITLLFLAILASSIFIVNLSHEDKLLVISKMKNIFFVEEINYFNFISNSFLTNLIYITLIVILGLSIIGIPLVLFIFFIKIFVIGFTLSAFIITFKIKGLIGSLLYLMPVQLLIMISIFIVSIYSINFSFNLLKEIRKGNSFNYKRFFRQYIFIYLISLGIILLSSLLEGFYLINIFKLLSSFFK